MNLAVKGADVDAQVGRGLSAVPATALEGLADEELFHGFEAHGPSPAGGAGGGRPQFSREVVQFDKTAAAEDEGLLDDVLQLADVAGVAPVHQAGHHLVGDPRDLLALEAVEAVDQVIDQQGDILAAFPQGRQFQVHHADAIVQVLAEGSAPHEFGQIPVGRRDHADVDADGDLAPDAVELAFRKHAQEAAAYFKKLGATRLVECWGDDVPKGVLTDFYKATKAEEGETPIFSWIEYPDKATRDAANKAMSEDAEMADMRMPFDGKRMFWGGFEQVVDE